MATFNTERLKKLVSYAVRGVGANKLLELSTYIGIRVDGNVLYLNTTDGTNYLCVSDTVDMDNFDVTVDADLFAKLVSKVNSNTVDIDVSDNSLIVTGEGKYTLPIIPDENGNSLSFPDKFPEITEEIGLLEPTDLSVILSSVKASLSGVTGSVYSSYYLGDIVVSTDRAMMTVYNRKLFDTPLLFNKEIVELVMTGNNVSVSVSSDNMLILETAIDATGTICVCTKLPKNVSDFQVGVVNKFMSLEVPSFCRVKKAQLLDLLDRLALFVSKFDDGAITLHFTDSYIEVSSLKSDGVERVDYTESKDAVDTIIKINIDRLRGQLRAYCSDTVDIHYGSDMCIKLVDGDVTQIIALIK